MKNDIRRTAQMSEEEMNEGTLLEQSMKDQADLNMKLAIERRELVGRLTNWRNASPEREAMVLRGHHKIMNLIYK